MENVINVLKKEFIEGYTLFDRLFMLSMLALQIIVFIINPTDTLSIVAGTAGVISVILTAKGKISSYFIGFIQTCTYLVLAYNNRFYGEVLENIFYFVTMILGIVVWNKHLDESRDVETKKFTIKQWIISIVSTIVLTIIMGFILTKINSNQAYTDACTNILAIYGQLLMVYRYREQWVYWLLIDLLCIKMWFVQGNISMVAMYIAWTINCIYGWYNWSKNNKNTK